MLILSYIIISEYLIEITQVCQIAIYPLLLLIQRYLVTSVETIAPNAKTLSRSSLAKYKRVNLKSSKKPVAGDLRRIDFDSKASRA